MTQVEVLLPQYSMGMQEAILVGWTVDVGASVTQWQPIAMIEAEKVEVDLVAPVAGTISQLVAGEGETLVVQQVLAYIQTP
jgi:pyruvate/2-oxoglutarate dehydrogenase complex dihydrolipoamide acyltransferase (E2) component